MVWFGGSPQGLQFSQDLTTPGNRLTTPGGNAPLSRFFGGGFPGRLPAEPIQGPRGLSGTGPTGARSFYGPGMSGTETFGSRPGFGGPLAFGGGNQFQSLMGRLMGDAAADRERQRQEQEKQTQRAYLDRHRAEEQARLDRARQMNSGGGPGLTGRSQGYGQLPPWARTNYERDASTHPLAAQNVVFQGGRERPGNYRLYDYGRGSSGVTVWNPATGKQESNDYGPWKG